MVNDVYGMVRKYRLCIWNHHTNNKQCNHQPSPLHRRLKYVAMNKLCSFPKTRSGKQFIVVITDLYPKLTIATSTARTTVAAVVTISFDHWISNFGIQLWTLADNGPQITSKFFLAICTELWITPSTATKYHPQSNGQGGGNITRKLFTDSVIMLASTRKTRTVLYRH